MWLALTACMSGPGRADADPDAPDPDPTAPTLTLPPGSTPDDTPGTAPPTDTGPRTAADCFGAQWGAAAPVDYDQFSPVINASCSGTNHQDIQDVERVVFIGDSITQGTPPTAIERRWRNQVAAAAVAAWGLAPPSERWKGVDVIDGDALETFSGDFANCSQWGARTDDLLLPSHYQLETCMPEADRSLRTLVMMTLGGNDIFSLLEDDNAGVDEATLRATYDEALALMREGVEWLVEPGRFPNGVYVVFADTYDFTDPDGADDMARCDGARLIGMDDALRDPVIQDILGRAQEEYVHIATDTQTDVVFLGEAFCGHGYDRDDATSRCYRGADSELWLDLTCEHPSPEGHDALAELFEAVIAE